MDASCAFSYKPREELWGAQWGLFANTDEVQEAQKPLQGSSQPGDIALSPEPSEAGGGQRAAPTLLVGGMSPPPCSAGRDCSPEVEVGEPVGFGMQIFQHLVLILTVYWNTDSLVQKFHQTTCIGGVQNKNTANQRNKQLSK